MQDLGCLSRHRRHDEWTGRNLLTDEEVYKQQYEDMKLLQYQSFIFPEEIAYPNICVILVISKITELHEVGKCDATTPS